MCNDVPIRDADDNKQAFATREASPRRRTQRTLAQIIVGGAPADVSASAPVPVDTEIPAAAPSGDAHVNAAVPAVVTRSQLWDTPNRRRPSQIAADGRRARALPAQVPVAQRWTAADLSAAALAVSSATTGSGAPLTTAGTEL